jgi:hypothetical protein
MAPSVGDIRHLTVAVFTVALEALGLLAPDVVQLEPRGHHDGADLLLDERVFGVVVHGALEAHLPALAAGVLGEALAAALEEGAVLAVEHRDVGHRLREWYVDRGALAEPGFELAGDALRRAGRLAVAAAVAEVLVHRAGFLADRHGEVADVAVDLLDLAPGVELDVGVLVRLDHAWREDALRAVERGEGLAELAHVATDRGLLLDENDLVAAVGDVERCLDAGDAAADHEGALGDGDADALQRPVVLDLLDDRAGDVDGFRGGLAAVFMDPAAVLADVGHLAEVRVEAGLVTGAAERLLVHVRRARSDHDAGEVVLFDGLLDQLLARVRAHVLVVFGEGNAGVVIEGRGDRLAVDGAADVLAAVADEDADAAH